MSNIVKEIHVLKCISATYKYYIIRIMHDFFKICCKYVYIHALAFKLHTHINIQDEH